MARSAVYLHSGRRRLSWVAVGIVLATNCSGTTGGQWGTPPLLALRVLSVERPGRSCRWCVNRILLLRRPGCRATQSCLLRLYLCAARLCPERAWVRRRSIPTPHQSCAGVAMLLSEIHSPKACVTGRGCLMVSTGGGLIGLRYCLRSPMELLGARERGTILELVLLVGELSTRILPYAVAGCVMSSRRRCRVRWSWELTLCQFRSGQMTWSELEMILFNVRHCSVTRWRCSEDRDAMCCLLPRSTRCARYPGGSLLGLLHSTGCCVIVQRIPVHCCWMLPLIRCLLEQIGGRRTVSTSIPPDTADWRTLRPRCSGFLTRSCSLGWSGPSMTPPVRTLRQLLVTLSGFVATQCRGLRGECAGVRRVRAWLPRMTR